ncbi:MAG: purine-nucleoside phosphorylase [Longimicrobiales bacterium]|nr:purine-nucleoside phosphorylase [Longimicrobiales bacterium]
MRDGRDDGEAVDRSVELLRRATPLRPRILIVLGSGLGGLVDGLTEAVSLPLHELSGMPEPGVAGHRGRLLAGRLVGTPVWIQDGRLHAYEGHPVSVVAAPIRIAASLGVRVVVLTNAAGGIRGDLDTGSLVLLAGLLNLTFRDPRVGGRAVARSGRPDSEIRPTTGVVPGTEAGGAPGTDLFVTRGAPGDVFDQGLQELALEAARRRKVPLSRGVYAGVLGPSFETPAEIRMIARLGGDVVGMSTVPEALEARAAGLKVLGFSLVTNRAAGLRPGSLSHEEVVSSATVRGGRLAGLIRDLVGDLDPEAPTDRRSD